MASARAPVEDLVREAGGDAAAVSDGRVFRAKVRLAAGTVVLAGEEIEIHAPSAVTEVRVLHRSRSLVVVDKPAGIPTIADHGGREHSLQSAAARAIDVAPESLHPTSRLDRDVSGIVVFARDAAGRERLAAARESGNYERRYVALAARAPSASSGVWDAPIGRAKNPKLRAARGREAVAASTAFRVLATIERAAFLSLEPKTGRTHQIRVHASDAGAPLLGDGDYGGPTRMTLAGGKSLSLKRVYLHCARVALRGLGEEPELVFLSRLPEAFTELWTALDGDPQALGFNVGGFAPDTPI